MSSLFPPPHARPLLLCYLSALTKEAKTLSSFSSRAWGLSYSRMMPRFITITRSAFRMVWTRCWRREQVVVGLKDSGLYLIIYKILFLWSRPVFVKLRSGTILLYIVWLKVPECTYVCYYFCIQCMTTILDTSDISCFLSIQLSYNDVLNHFWMAAKLATIYLMCLK